MKRPHDITSHGLTWALIGVCMSGISLSMVLTSDPRWINWHLSRLGEGGHVSSAIFNCTLIVGAVVFVLLARKIAQEVEDRWNDERAARLLRIFFTISAISWIGVASFPFDRFPVVHNIFGYSQFFAACIIMVLLKQICPTFSRRTIQFGYTAFALTFVLMMVFHVTHAVSLLLVEIVGEFAMFGWLLSMTTDLNARK